MKISKTCAVLALLCVCATFFVQAQATNRRSETSVENEYLNDTDGMIIMGLASSDEYDNKRVALEYLQNAINSGNTSEAVIAALDQLAGEGITTQSRQRGRLMNNFPDIRREACMIMTKVPTEHTKNTLIEIATQDAEPSVMAAAIRALGEVGINNNDETVDAITFANRRNQVMNPTSSLAFEVLNALEKLAPSTENKRMIVDAAALIAADNHYVRPVRDRALALIKSMSTSGGDN